MAFQPELLGPVPPFRSGEEFSILPNHERDDEDDLKIVHGRLIEPAFPFGCRLRAAGGKGSFAAAEAAGWHNADLQLVSRPLAAFALRGPPETVPQTAGREELVKKGGRASAGRSMERQELEELRERVSCAVMLEQADFAVDVRESTRKAVKYRRGAEIIIVIHEGRGWFDPLSDAKGDVFRLAEHLDGVSFVTALDRVASLVGFISKEPVWSSPPRGSAPTGSMPQRWDNRRKPSRGSMTWRYLHVERCLPEAIIREAIRRNMLRAGPYGSMWAAHLDDEGVLTGWEERGPAWRGFSSGGSKVLFRLGSPDAVRLCVTEAAIDAMSLAALEGLREGSLYLSTGGGWSPKTEAAVRVLAARPCARIVAATDANSQGEAFATRLRDIADEAGCDWLRLAPWADDWNEALCVTENHAVGHQADYAIDRSSAVMPRVGAKMQTTRRD